MYIREDETEYPSTHTRYELPILIPKGLKTAELLHHRGHIIEKIQRLVKLQNEGKREAQIGNIKKGKR